MWISNTATVAMMLPIVEAVAAAMHCTEVILCLFQCRISLDQQSPTVFFRSPHFWQMNMAIRHN
jgi:hypothetical protein